MASGQQMLAPSSTAMHKATGGSEARFIPVTISGGNGSSAPQTAVAAGANGLAGSGNGGTQRGYTILVPANVRFRGVNMQLDLKIDQKTLAAASSISKAVQDAVNARQCGAGGGVHSRLQAATTSSSSATTPLEAGDVDCLDRSATLSNSLRLKTGGRNPREILAEKLRKINGKRSSNGSLVTRSAAPSPSWYKQLPMTPQAGQISSPVTVDAPRPASAHVFGEGVLPHHHRPLGNGSLPSPLVDDSSLFGGGHDGGNDLAALLRLPGADPSSAFPFDDLLPLADIDGVDPLLAADTDGGHFMNLDETLDSVVRSATQSQPDGVPSQQQPPQSAPPTAKRSRKGDKNSQGSHFCEFSDSDRACKQRAILTYRYCIRHILNDPDSPYMPCQHMRKPKSKRDTNLQCTNAIRKDKEVAFCSTHMIMMGMLEPKTKKAQPNGNAKEAPSPMNAMSLAPGEWPPMPMGSNGGGGVDDLPDGQSPGVVSDGIASSTGGDWTPLSYQHHNASPYPKSPMMPPMASSVYSAQTPFARHSPALVSPMPSPSTSYWNSPAVAPLQQQQQQQFVNFGVMAPQTQSLHQMQPAGAPSGPQAPLNFGYQPPSLPNGFDANGYGSSAVSPLSNQSLVRSNSVASGNSRPDSTLSQAVTPGPPTTVRAAPGLVLSQDLAPPAPHPLAQLPPAANKAPQQSELMRQHPELAAKLLQTVKTTVPSTIAESAVAPMAVAVQAEPAESPCHQFVRPVQAPCVVNRPVVPPPMNVAPPALQHLPSMAPVFQPRPLPLPTLPSVSVDGQPPKKVIRLKQKRQRMRMLGNYRQVPSVNQMCKVLEDADFDRTDLFPLGLEPSESDTDSEEGDSNLGGRTTDACFADRVLRLAQDWEAVGALGGTNEQEGDSRRQLYLIKKQLRLERHRLLCSARINAAVMHASKRYPNLVGRALLDRRKRQANQLRKRMLRKALGVPKRFAGKRVEDADLAALRHRRCCFLEHGDQQRQGGRRAQCSQRCLSYSNHCLKHSLCSVDQRLFRYCAESLCDEPVIDLGMDAWLPAGGRCARHRDLRPESGMSDLTDESTTGGRRRPIRRFPCERKVKRRRRAPAKADEPDGPPRMTSSPLLDHDTSGGALMPSGSALLSGGVNEADVSLASVAKDLGFEGSELTDMLAKFPVVEGDDFDFVGPDFGIGKSTMLEQPSLASAVASAMQQPPSTLNPSGPEHCDDGADGHNWADVEQFLLSEGYQGASFQPSDLLCQPGGLLPPIGTTLGHPPPPSLDVGLVHPPPPYCAPAWTTGESR